MGRAWVCGCMRARAMCAHMSLHPSAHACMRACVFAWMHADVCRSVPGIERLRMGTQCGDACTMHAQ
eukprot:4101162-Alexandrium_andersonii.AAC.1